MEVLEGIMIATTNLTANLDKAFERRFLYKIQFNRPTVDARAQIWQAMLPLLTKDDAHTRLLPDLTSQVAKSRTSLVNVRSTPFCRDKKLLTLRQ